MSAADDEPKPATAGPDTPRGWPAGVQPITFGETARLGVSRDGLLYWDGKPVEVRRTLDLTFWQRIVAIVVTFSLIAGGLGGLAQGIVAGHDFGCRRAWWICPR